MAEWGALRPPVGCQPLPESWRSVVRCCVGRLLVRFRPPYSRLLDALNCRRPPQRERP